MKKIFVQISILAAVALPTYAADIIYGSTDEGAYFTVDTQTAATHFINTLRPCGIEGATEIEYDPVSGKAFAIAPDGAFCGAEFDPTSGIVNPTTFFTVPGSATGGEFVAGVGYFVTTNGGPAPTNLYSFNPTTHVFTPVGPTGVNAPISGMAYNSATSTMYGVSAGPLPSSGLYTINLTTGAATFVGDTGVKLGSLEYGADGLLYAGGAQANDGILYRINTTTGAATIVGDTGQETLTGLMLAPAFAAMPALDAKGLAALCVLLAAAGAIALRMKS